MAGKPSGRDSDAAHATRVATLPTGRSETRFDRWDSALTKTPAPVEGEPRSPYHPADPRHHFPQCFGDLSEIQAFLHEELKAFNIRPQGPQQIHFAGQAIKYARAWLNRHYPLTDGWPPAFSDKVETAENVNSGFRDLIHFVARLAKDGVQRTDRKPEILKANAGEPAVENDPPQWPPDDGWHFQPGEAAFSGTVFEIAGQSWKLLKIFAEKGRPVSWTEISEQLASDPNIQLERENVKVHVSDLRTILRRHFDCGNSDPIPNVDRGSQLAWRLDLSVLRPHSKSV